MNILKEIKDRYADHRLNRIDKLELSVNQKGYHIQSSPSSPERLMPDKLKITLKTLPRQLSIAKGMEKAVKSLDNNPSHPKTTADETFLGKFEEYARSLGIASIGYTKVPPEYIFQKRSLLYSNAIIFTLEMDKKIIDTSPSPETQAMGLVTYDDLGIITNKLADYLRENGFSAQSSIPAGGFVMYPWLAQKAGLGWTGRHGLLITPEFGPRQRISAIFTSIENLPLNNENGHSWMPSFCTRCGNCIKSCPANALLKTPISHEDGRFTHINPEKCEGCTICMRDCSFNKRKYTQIRTKFEKSKRIEDS
jgi:epoxyqueuosine reductase